MAVNRIYFAQHGLAIDKAENPDRPLSAAGIKQTEAIANHIQSANIPVSKIFHSGKLRAAQTAEIFAARLNVSASAMEHLSANDEVTLITQGLTVENALYIGHLPHLEKLLAYLLTGKETPNIVKMQNSAMLCLEKTDALYQLQWYLTPELA